MYKDLIEKMNETIDAINTLQAQLDGRSTPIEDFPEDGLHPETEKVIAEFMATESLLAALDRLATAWKSQHPITPSIPLVWRIEDGLLYLDDIFVTPVSHLRGVIPSDFCEYTIGLLSNDGRIEIVIASRDEKPYRIERIERDINAI